MSYKFKFSVIFKIVQHLEIKKWSIDSLSTKRKKINSLAPSEDIYGILQLNDAQILIHFSCAKI